MAAFMTPSEYHRVSRRFGLGLRQESMLLGLLAGATAFEGVGIGMLLPIIELIQTGSDAAALRSQSAMWDTLFDIFGFVGAPVTLATLIGASFLAIVCRQIFSYIRQVYLTAVRQKLSYDIRNFTFERYLRADLSYHDAERPGQLVNNLMTELVLSVDSLLAPIQIITYTVMVGFYTTILLLLSGPVTIAAFAVIGIAGISLMSVLRKTHASGKMVASANDKMAAFLVERLRLVRLIRLSGAETAELSEMENLTRSQRTGNVQMYESLARVNVMIEPVAIGIGFLGLYLGHKVFDLNFAEIALFGVVAVMRLLPAVKELIGTWQASLGYYASLKNLLARLDSMERAAETRGGELPFVALKREVELDNVHFEYASRREQQALKAITLSIPANQVSAIVGPSGAGKSTLVDLLPRLREPTNGCIRFDGEPLEHFSVRSLRRGIAFVPQTPLVFDTTIAGQIRYGAADASDSEIEEAARLAGAHSFISALPGGYDTRLGNEGVSLSGGQRQRLELARALAQRASILILDEPTSNLDADAEDRFRRALQRIRNLEGTTVIVIAHRLSTIIDADKIIVLNAGHVETVGTHEEVLARNAWYKDAYKKQHMGDGQTDSKLAVGAS
jgi:subfamily B ATP-binding cassette protein MsbA